MEKAQESLGAGRLLLDNGFPAFSASRSYYAMFYAAEALLASEGLSLKSHGAVAAGFGRHFAKTGRMPAASHRDLLDALEQRHLADYQASAEITPEEAAALLIRAENFLAAARRLLEEGQRRSRHGARQGHPARLTRHRAKAVRQLC